MVYGGDPNLGVLLVPLGAGLLLMALLLVGRETLAAPDGDQSESSTPTAKPD